MKYLKIIFVGLVCLNACFANVDFTNLEDEIEIATSLRISNSKDMVYMLDDPVSPYYSQLIKIVNTLNDIWFSRGNVKFSKYIYALWKNDPSVISAANFPEINHPEIKLELAQLIGQSSNHCFLDIDISSVKSYVYEQLNTENASFKLSAISALGSLGDESDIPYLEAVILEEKSGYAETAIIALGLIPNKNVIKKLRDLQKIINDKKIKQFLDEELIGYGESFQGFTSKSCKKNHN